MVLKDWTIKVEINEKGTCVHVHIDKDISIEGLELELIDSERKSVLTMKVLSYEIYVCTSVEEPLFAKIGNCVKYIDGSGYETYHDIKKG